MSMIQPGTYIEHNWHKSPEGREYFASILRHGSRQTFGCLETPTLPTHLTSPQVVRYKLCLAGKAAVGKSSTVAKLCGQPVPMTHCETPGIVTSTAFWPAKLKDSGKAIMFRLDFWDAGEGVNRKFDHIQPACRDKAHAILYLFSFVDRSSFEDVRNQLSRPLPTEGSPLHAVIGTKYDQYNRSEITSHELRDFQQDRRVPVLKLKNVVKPVGTNALLAGDSSAEIDDVAPVLNTLVEYLWVHEQILAGRVVPGLSLGKEPSVDRRSERGAVADDDDDDDDEATYV